MNPVAQFDDVAAWLADGDFELGASEMHGSLVALACAFGEHGLELWFQDTLSGDDQASPSPDTAANLSRLFAATLGSLESGDFDFAVLLPDDDADLAIRARALAEWAAGFARGLGIAAGVAAVRERLEAEPLEEIVTDVVAISRAAVDDASDTPERDEVAYAELVEYLRVAAQLSFEELTPVRVGAGATTSGIH